MRFQGEIIAEACRVEVGSHRINVIMGQVRSNHFHAVGEEGRSVPFHIGLLDCSNAVSQRVSIAFYGMDDGKNPQVLSVGEGGAIFDEKNELIPFNSSVRSSTAQPNDGPLFIALFAK